MESFALQHDSVPITDARQRRSRRALTDALLTLLNELPFEQITIREISVRAGTGYATFFRHYPTREALLADIASAEITDLLALTMPIMTASSSAESTKVLCDHVAARSRLWTALLTGGAAGIVRAEFIRQARVLAESLPEPESWLPGDLAVVHGTGGTFDLLAWWLAESPDSSAHEIAGILDRLIIAPLVGKRLTYS